MKKVIFAILFMLPVMVCAEKKPVQNTSDYTITVHVQSSQVIDRYDTPKQLLDVVIDGKKYELEAWPAIDVLPVGDYKAKIFQEKNSPKP